MFLASVALAQPEPEESAKAKHVDAKGAALMLKKDSKIVTLDIRTPEEFKSGHIKGAKNIDFRADTFESDIGKLDRSKTYLVHCASGGRSGRSLADFQKLKFKHIIHLDGGYRGWEKEGLPVVK